MSIELAEQYEEQEQYEQAYEEYKKLLNARPKSVELLQRTAHVASILGKQDEAEKYFSKILEYDASNEVAYEQLMDMFINSDKYKYYTYRGNLHLLQQKFEHAAGDFKKALDKAPDTNRANVTRFILATIYAQIGKDNNAIDEYLRIIDTHEAPEEAYLNLAKIYEAQDVITSAIEILERALKDGHETKHVKEALADLYLKNNQTDEAAKTSSDKLVQLRCLIEDENFDEAKVKIEEMNADYKKNPKFLTLVAQFYYAQKDFEKAFEYVDEFAKFDKNSPLVYQMRALIYEEKGQDFEEHYNWAKYNYIRGNKDVALNEYMQAYNAKSEDSVLVLTIAELLDEMKDRTHAAEFYEKLSNLEPNNKKALERLGEFRESIGDYKMSVEYFERLYEIDKRNSSILKSLAKGYEKTKRPDKAADFYSKYLSSSAISEDEAAEIKKKIEKLESKTKNYTDATSEDDGLIGAIMKFFGK
ncbi:tetratricopeptide repeat protein [bacterium]|nr:tetratricopeptide repeat protein [bacterium]